MHELEFWKLISETLYIGLNVCLVVMVNATGDGPNRPGSKMAIMPDGRRFGTVGGGNSEKFLSDTALDMLGSTSSEPRLITLNHGDGNEGDESGMICSGTQVFALARLSSEDRVSVHQILRAMSEGIPGILKLSVTGLTFSESANFESSQKFDPNAWSYEEALNIDDTVTIIGGGHVSLALTPLLVSLGMRVTILDNRPNLDTMEANTLAHDLRVIDYKDIRSHVPLGDHSFVCIMTFGHEHDEMVLRQLANLDLKYLGMMGSAHKIGTIFEHLRVEGIPQEKLDKIHAPIGLAIGSNTPEEIAISIAAEIIGVRRGTIT